MFLPLASKIWTKSYGPNLKKKKKKKKKKKRVFKNHFWQSVDASLEDVSGAEISVYLKTTIFSMSQKLR